MNKQTPNLVYALKKATGLGIAEVKERLSQGRAAHLFRAELYLNDHVEVDSKIREILAILKKHGVAAHILEILYDESWDDPIDPDLSLISEDVLLNMLDEADGEYR